jgi:hypothetical protein
MINDSLRNAKDGVSYFGIDSGEISGLIDYILNVSNVFDNTSIIFKIYFDKKQSAYFLSSQNVNNDSVIFIKVEKMLVKVFNIEDKL